MEYKIGNILFSKDTEYDKITFWKLYRIYVSLEHTTKDPDYASNVVGEYGILLFKDIKENANTNDIRKDLINEIKKWIIESRIVKGHYNKPRAERYYDRIVYSIPKNILDKIQNIELFKLGYIEKNIYDELMAFKNELKKWLENPKGTNIHYDIDRESPVLTLDFHDRYFRVKKEDNKLELIGIEHTAHIVCENCKTIIINSEGKEIINDYKNKKNYEFDCVDGYTYYGVYIKNSEKKEFLLETNSNEATNIIIETDNIKHID